MLPRVKITCWMKGHKDITLKSQRTAAWTQRRNVSAPSLASTKQTVGNKTNPASQNQSPGCLHFLESWIRFSDAIWCNASVTSGATNGASHVYAHVQGQPVKNSPRNILSMENNNPTKCSAEIAVYQWNFRANCAMPLFLPAWPLLQKPVRWVASGDWKS